MVLLESLRQKPSEVDVQRWPVPVRIVYKVLRGGDLCLSTLDSYPRRFPGSRDIFLDGRAANVVQMYTVNSVGAKFAHGRKICGLFLSFSTCEQAFVRRV